MTTIDGRAVGPQPSEQPRADGPEQSPDLLVGPPKRGVGVRRLSKRPILMIGAGVSVAALVMAYSMNERAKSQNAAPKDAAQAEQVQAGVEPAVLAEAPKAGIVPASDPASQAVNLIQVAADPTAGTELQVPALGGHAPTAAQDRMATLPQGGAGPNAPATYPSPYEAEWRQYDQVRAAQRQARFERASMALGADSQVRIDRSGAGEGNAPPPNPLAQMAAALATPPASPSTASASRDFYSPARLEAARSPTELKAGSVIPAVLLGGLNSELPGQIVGQVTRNVYDSTTGRFLLIPQGSRVVGEYNSDVSYGQARVQVAWKRLILPDGASLDLSGTPGLDRSGYAGLRDKVNNHFARTYGSALMVSLFSAGVQLSQPQASNSENVSAGQTAAGALGQEVGRLGMEQARKNLNIKPELVIRPGYRFNVSVTADLIMREWKGR